ncbi:MAG: hypothetical protein AAFP81_18535 [Pseudomonadota bacterium]
MNDIESYSKRTGKAEGTISRILFGDGSRYRILKTGKGTITQRVLMRARADLNQMISGSAGEQLRGWRGKIQLSKPQAAAIFGVSSTTYSNWEDGGVPPAWVERVHQVTTIPLHQIRPDTYAPPHSNVEAAYG